MAWQGSAYSNNITTVSLLTTAKVGDFHPGYAFLSDSKSVIPLIYTDDLLLTLKGLCSVYYYLILSLIPVLLSDSIAYWQDNCENVVVQRLD